MKTERVSDLGITLLEILVALTLIALATGAIIISVPAQSRPLDVETAKLEDTFEQLADRAVLTGKLHALEMTRDSYSGLAFENGEWVAMRAPRERLPRSMSLRPGEEIAPLDARRWQILFSPTGVKTEGTVRLSGRSRWVDLFPGGEPEGDRP